MDKPLILILCTGNSCRSQMAEYWLQQAVGDIAEVASAGSNPAGYVHEGAVKVMAEKGFDLSQARSKHLNEFLDKEVTTVITVCGNADEACPTFPGRSKRYHWGFYDPAHAEGSEEEVLEIFRTVRDEIEKVFTAYGSGLVDA